MNDESTSRESRERRLLAESMAKTAEAQAKETLTPEEAGRLLHELRVHQIELEMQNEELRRIQLELETSHARYFDLYDLAPVGYFTFSEKGIILEANLTIAGMLGVARAALADLPVSRLIHRDDQDVFYLHRRRLFATYTPQLFELRLIGRGGLPLWVSVEATSAQDPQGATVGRAVVSDISERKLVEEERRRHTLELETANASLKQSGTQLRKLAAELTQAEERERKRLAAVLHDHLQQFLVAAQMKIGLIHRRTRDRDLAGGLLEARDLLKQAIGASQSLAADLHPPVLLDAGLMPGLRWLVGRMSAEHGLTVEVTGEDALDTPEHINIMLFHAVRELLLNIVKHAGVDVASVTLDRPGPGELRVVVHDAGSGFSPDTLVEGFGLFHLRERLCYIGGSMDVESSPGHGARIKMTVPFDPPPKSWPAPMADREARPPAPREGEQGVCHLLVVDDHTIMRQGLIELLGKEPDMVVVGVAADGVEAIQAARELRPDVVLMDVSMPGINGIDATRIITREVPEAQVIGLSMHDDAVIRSKMREAGAAACCHKGDPVEGLIETVRAASRSRT